MQFWDWKKLDKPLISRQDHSHWVWSVNYNLSYDQLVVSSSSDSQVSLARVASVASEPLQHLTDPDDTSPPVVPDDGVIAVYEEHEDSVYAVRWSTADAWVFASLSYDGRFVINHVPSNEKYAILTS
jgi:WD40 repeat protein